MDRKAGEKSKFFQIPIHKYEKDMETESAKEKKKEILDLFANSNNLRSEEEFDEIKEDLHYAIKKGDVELIKIYISETIENISKDIKYKIDRTNQTASLFKVKGYSIFPIHKLIPRTIQHESTDYLITSISGTCFNMEFIEFAEDSAVRKIYRNAFPYLTNIEEIHFPASLKELEEGWCDNAHELRKIKISPLNDQFIMKEGNYLLGKSDQKTDEFDKLLFVRRDIKDFSIPPYIKIISSGAFSGCLNLKEIEIPQNTNLQTIGKYAFSTSSIEKFIIPSKVSIICKNAFYNCQKLTKVEIPQNSNLQKIGSNAFAYSKIEEIYLPASLKELKEGWCYNTKYLTKIDISPLNDQFTIKEDKYLLGKSDKETDEFDVLLFACRDIEDISIPSNIKIISSYAFSNCTKLTNIEIPQNSNLQTISEYAFETSSIKKIYLPANLKELKEGWCYNTKYLTKIDISPLNDQFTIKENKYLLGKSDKETDEFDVLLFACRDIEDISIPSNIKIISSDAFTSCKKLMKIEIPQNSNLQTIKISTFSKLNIKEIFIPSKVSKISKYSFSLCRDLTNVEIPQNSNLKAIKTGAFSYSNIKEIFIPSKVSKICKDAFLSCGNMDKVEIPQNSSLKIIGSCAFSFTKIKSIFIPSKVSQISEYAFANCDNLQIVEISEQSTVISNVLTIFAKCSNIIVMIPFKKYRKKVPPIFLFDRLQKSTL